MNRRTHPWQAFRYLVVIVALIMAFGAPSAVSSAVAPGVATATIIANSEDPNDPEVFDACDPDDPDWDTRCEQEECEAEADDPEEGPGDEDEEEDCEGENRDGFLDSRMVPGGVITTGDLELAAAQAASMTEELHGLVDPNWTFAGPPNVPGRVTDIGPDPTLSGRVFVATANGGVLVGDGAAATFELTSTWPDDFPQAIGAVTVAPNGDVWVGTGEVNPGGGSLGYGGDGLYRSTDHGATWARVPGWPSGATTIGAIRFNPANPNVVYVASAGSLFAAGGVRGLYKSADYGATFNRVLAGVNDYTGATDIAMDPVNPDKLFVPMWDHHREWLCRCYTGLGTGLYLTEDGGATWTRLENDRITAMTPGDNIGFAATDNDTTTAQARLGVGIAPSDPNRVYVVTGNWNQIQNGAGQTQRGFRGRYRSDDGGLTFQTMSNPNPGADTVWTSKIWVDPANPDVLYVAGVNLRRSTNGGASWGSVSSVHVDHHAMAWDPTTTGRVYEGNDGGVYRSTSNGNNGTWVSGTGQFTTQFYTVSASEQDPDRIVGGTQDNGCLRSWNNAGNVTGPWGSYGGCGDGLYTVIDPSDHNFVYACSQFGSCSRSVNAGNNSSSYTNQTTSQRRNWETPVVLDPTDPAVVYYGGNILNRSTNRALNGTWSAISPSLSNPASGTDPSYPFGTITTVAAAPTNPNVLYAGTDDGWLWGTKDLGTTWTRFTDPALPDRWVTRVAVDPTDANRAYVTYSGLRNADNNAHVLRTIDGGQHWVDISGNLPMAPTQDVVIDPLNPNRVFVASDLGVFTANVAKAKNQGGSAVKWYRLGHGLPRSPVNDIHYNAASNSLFAATYGRGIWVLQLDRDD